MNQILEQIQKSQQEKYANLIKQVKNEINQGTKIKDLKLENNYRSEICFETIMDIKKVINCESEFR